MQDMCQKVLQYARGLSQIVQQQQEAQQQEAEAAGRRRLPVIQSLCQLESGRGLCCTVLVVSHWVAYGMLKQQLRNKLAQRVQK